MNLLLPGETRVLARLPLLTPKLIVDVGSNLGDWSNEAEASCPEARVLRFDPLSGTPAIGAEDGEIDFFHFPSCHARSTAAKHYAVKIKEVPMVIRKRVPLRRLDTILAGETPDFLKVDVEGMSLDVLLGLGELRPTVIQFEWGWAENAEGAHLGKFWDLFQSGGYIMRELDIVGYDNAADSYFNFLAGKASTLEKFF